MPVTSEAKETSPNEASDTSGTGNVDNLDDATLAAGDDHTR